MVDFQAGRERRTWATNRLRGIAAAVLWSGVIIGAMVVVSAIVEYLREQVTPTMMVGGLFAGLFIIGNGYFWGVILHAGAETLACLGRMEDGSAVVEE
ncbi:MAG: hypothetical protein ACYC6A_24670 [Armatimonadota bacterium]